jgi:translocation and assembly module TamA
LLQVVHRPRAALLAVLLTLLHPAAAQEDRALTYTATVAPTGESALDTALTDASRLRRLAEEAPVDAFGLVARARAELPLVEEVLQSQGFWAGRAQVLVAGEPADAPGLAERLAGRQAAEPVPVEIRVTPGARYTVRRVELRPESPAEAEAVRALGAPPGIAPGDEARAAPVLDAETALVDRLRDGGHPLARVADREVVVDHTARAMDVTWVLSPGPRATFAAPEITGETAVNRRLIERVAGRLTGEPYSPARLEETRRQLIGLGAFDAVRTRAGQRLDEAGRLPVTFAVTDRPRNAAGFTLAYETNYGPTGRVYFERRNLFGNAERLRIEGEVSRLGAGGGTEDINYRLGANFRRPGLIDGRTTLVADVALLRERLEAYDRDAFVTSVLLERPIGERWVVQAGPTFETGRIGRDGNLDPFTLAGLVTTLRYDGTDSLLDPRRGIRANINVTPYADLAEGGGFIRAFGTLRTYFDVTGSGATVVALRGTLGTLYGADRAVPLDKRFYAGGGGSVRGYGYQRIGPRDARDRPVGGNSLVEASVEIRQRVTETIGVVGFVDAGSVGSAETPSFSDMRYGAGLGLRYLTGIGPLRLDVAVPLNKQSGDAGYGIYVGLGQAF